MPVPPRLTNYIRQTYPKPTVDPTWLDACLSWIADELGVSLDSEAHIDDIIRNVDIQLLNSDLRDSMLTDSGLPRDIGTQENTRLHGRTLVQIQGIMEIGHSAFSLKSVHQTRVDRVDLAGLAGGDGGENMTNGRVADGGENEDEGPIPKFPQSMLMFDLCDGSQLLRAIEFRRLPELELGVTPLGYKMILKDVPIRRGIAFLEPANVELKGHLNEELDINRQADFERGLRVRLGQPEPDPTHEDNPNAPASPARPNAGVHAGRTPLRELSMEELNPRIPSQRVIPREELEPPSRRRVPAPSPTLSDTVVSSRPLNTGGSLFSKAASSSTLASGQSPPLRGTPLSSGRPSGELNIEEDEFGEDLDIDEAFFEELEAVEQAALSTSREGGTQDPNASTIQPAAPTVDHSEVIIIDSDSDDKENSAPTQRRVRRRIAPREDNENLDIIVIE